MPDAFDRLALEAERHELEQQLDRLTAAIKLGGSIPQLVDEMKSINLRLRDVRCRLEPREQQDRERLRAALEQRVDEWREILRPNPAQGRQLLKHVIGPIMLWVGQASDLAIAHAAEPRDQRGRENLTPGDLRWEADVRPEGLLVGLGAPSVWRARQDSNL